MAENRNVYCHVTITSHFQVRVLKESWPYFAVLDSRLSQLRGPGSHIYIAQEQGGPMAVGSLFVASYDSQGYDGGIRNRLHRGSLSNSPDGTWHGLRRKHRVIIVVCCPLLSSSLLFSLRNSGFQPLCHSTIKYEYKWELLVRKKESEAKMNIGP
jgi:hypothetical protein